MYFFYTITAILIVPPIFILNNTTGYSMKLLLCFFLFSISSVFGSDASGRIQLSDTTIKNIIEVEKYFTSANWFFTQGHQPESLELFIIMNQKIDKLYQDATIKELNYVNSAASNYFRPALKPSLGFLNDND